MADKTTFGFDPDKMMEFFKQNDFTRAFTDAKLPNFDTEALFAAQKKNMDALVEANKAAAAGYQDLFKKQMAIFEETISEAQTQIQEMELKMDSKAAAAQGEVAKAAFEKAIANMKELAETAQKANSEAYEIVSARVKESVAELRSLGDQLKAKK